MADQEKNEQQSDAEASESQTDEQADVEVAEEEEDNLPPVEVKTEDVGPLRKKLVITVPKERLDAKRNEAIEQLSDTVQVPGFRIGRAPRRLIEKRFGTELTDDVKSQMVLLGYEKAVEQSDLKVLGQPEFDRDKLDAIELPEDGPMTFDIEVEVQPEFELPKLEGIEIKRPPAEISDADVEQALDRWRGNFAQPEAVDGPAEADDILSVDLTFEPEGGEKHEHTNTQVAVRPQAVEGVPLENLGDKLTGAKAGDTVTVEAEIPEGHPSEELRGKKAVFTFAVKGVRRIRLPELDDEFVSRFGFETVGEFRDFIRERLTAEAGQHQQGAMREQVYAYLIDNTELELPEGVLGRMKDRAIQRRANELMMRGIPRTEIEKHMDELSVTAGEEAVRELKSLFILQRVAEQFEVEVTENEVNALISQMAAQYGRRADSIRDDLEKRGGLMSLYQQIQEQKAVDVLLEKANVVDAPVEEAKEEKSEKKTTKKKAKKKAAKKTAKSKSGAEDADAIEDEDSDA